MYKYSSHQPRLLQDLTWDNEGARCVFCGKGEMVWLAIWRDRWAGGLGNSSLLFGSALPWGGMERGLGLLTGKSGPSARVHSWKTLLRGWEVRFCQVANCRLAQEVLCDNAWDYWLHAIFVFWRRINWGVEYAISCLWEVNLRLILNWDSPCKSLYLMTLVMYVLWDPESSGFMTYGWKIQ